MSISWVLQLCATINPSLDYCSCEADRLYAAWLVAQCPTPEQDESEQDVQGLGYLSKVLKEATEGVLPHIDYHVITCCRGGICRSELENQAW